MAQYSSTELDAVYHALANSTRRKILTRLCQGSSTVSDLAAPFEMTLAGVSKHIKVLEKAGLVRKKVQGVEHICEVDFTPVESAAALIRFLEQHAPKQAEMAPQAAAVSAPAAEEKILEMA